MRQKKRHCNIVTKERRLVSLPFKRKKKGGASFDLEGSHNTTKKKYNISFLSCPENTTFFPSAHALAASLARDSANSKHSKRRGGASWPRYHKKTTNRSFNSTRRVLEGER